MTELEKFLAGLVFGLALAIVIIGCHLWLAETNKQCESVKVAGLHVGDQCRD